jgi:SAM-dependent methyltransferase
VSRLPPGTILQHRYVRRRLRGRPPGVFVEIGAGEGHLSRLLLDLGWTGIAYELGAAAAETARRLNAGGRLEVRETDWLEVTDPPRADLVVSSMVLEHLSDDDVARFLGNVRHALRGSGLLIVLVPASPGHWGVEDEVAGHLRRYTRASLGATLGAAGFDALHVAGLTFPLSNLLLPVSNRLVAKWEGDRRQLDARARTVASGSRSVPWKTQFPSAASILLNGVVLLPFYALQLATRSSERALVLYAEARPAQ